MEKQKVTAELFDNLHRLKSIPENNWYNGRREPCLMLIRNLLENEPDKINLLDIPSPSGGQINIAKISIDKEEFLFFEEIAFTKPKPTFLWFQLEKIIKSPDLSDNMYKTKLILSSDDNAVTQGGIMLMLFDNK